MSRLNGVLTPTKGISVTEETDATEQGVKGKKRLAILFGGQSTEHEISLRSSIKIINAINRSDYELTLIGVDKQGRWALYDETDYLLNPDDTARITLAPAKRYLAIVPGDTDVHLIEIASGQALPPIDVAFSVLHGAAGEDGAIQGLLRVLNIPFVGSDVLGSAICMDKEMAKRVLRDAGLPVAPWIALRRNDADVPDFDAVSAELGLPMFVKPASQGSSIGVSKVEDRAGFEQALKLAFSYDHKVLVEPAIIGREIEVAVLGNDQTEASLCGEIVIYNEFYTYDTKYDLNGAKFDAVIPANLEASVSDDIRRKAHEAFRAVGCGVTARVDFFYTEKGELLINEINALPGFIPSSVYPQLWEASGLSTPELVSKLLSLTLERASQAEEIKRDR